MLDPPSLLLLLPVLEAHILTRLSPTTKINWRYLQVVSELVGATDGSRFTFEDGELDVPVRGISRFPPVAQ